MDWGFWAVVVGACVLPLVGLSHALGWLARLIITALLAVWLVGLHVNLAPVPV